MDKKKTVIKFIRIIAFLLAFVLILGILSQTVFSAQRGSKYYNKRRHAVEYVNEPDNSIQIVGIGNSDLYSAMDPNYLWQNFGYTSTVSAAPRQTPFDSYLTLNEILKKQSPQVAIIEIDMIYTNDLDEKNDYSWRGVMTDYVDTDLMNTAFNRVFPVFYYHDKWKHYDRLTPEKHSTHGYVFIDKSVKYDPGEYMIPTDEKEEISKFNKEYITRIINICKSENIYPVFVEVPSPASWNYERHNAVQEFADELGVEFIDFNTNVDETGFDAQKHFRDKGNHLNYEGSCLITKYIGNYISDKNLLNDNRGNADYQYWQDNADAFDKAREERANKKK